MPEEQTYIWKGLDDNPFLTSEVSEDAPAPAIESPEYPSGTQWRGLDDNPFIEKAEPAGDYGWGITTAFKRGFERLRSLPDVAQGDYEELAQHFENMEKHDLSPEDQQRMQELQNTEGWWEATAYYFKNPALIAQVVAESLPMSTAPIAGGVAGGVAGGATAGPPGAVVGTMGGAAAGSYATEYLASITDYFSRQNIDATDPDQLKRAFNDPQLMEEAREFANQRGVPIAVFDGLSFGLAGRLYKPASALVKGAGGKTLGMAGEISMQAGAGMAGEAGAQLSSVGEIEDIPGVIAEGFGEIVPGLIEQGANAIMQRRTAEVEKDSLAKQLQADLTAEELAATEERDELSRQLEGAGSTQRAITGLLEQDAVVAAESKKVAEASAQVAIREDAERSDAFIRLETERDARIEKQRQEAFQQQEGERELELGTAREEIERGRLGGVVEPEGTQVATKEELAEEQLHAVGAQPAEGEIVAGEPVPTAGHPGTSVGEAMREAGIGVTEEPVAPESAPTPTAPEPVPEPAVEYVDERMKSGETRVHLERLAGELVPGRTQLVPDTEGGRIDPQDATAFTKRLPSVNPEWFKALNAAGDSVGVRYVQNAVDKAMAGKRLGVKQKRVVQTMLDEIDEQRAADARTMERPPVTEIKSKPLGETGIVEPEETIPTPNEAREQRLQDIEAEAEAREERAAIQTEEVVEEVEPDIPGFEDLETEANKAATSPKNDLPQPTKAQKEAGNYKKGHLTIKELPITIENPVGSTRRGFKMKDHYGYIKRTEGVDGDQVDVFVNPKIQTDDNNSVYVIDQTKEDGVTFDEHKVMMGYRNQLDAVRAYKRNYEKGWKVGPVTEMSVTEFKTWLEGDTKKPAQSKPSRHARKFVRSKKGLRYSIPQAKKVALSDAKAQVPGADMAFVEQVIGAPSETVDPAVQSLVTQITKTQDQRAVPHSQIPYLERDTQDKITREIAKLNKAFPKARIRLVDSANAPATIIEDMAADTILQKLLTTIRGIYDPESNRIYLFKDRIKNVAEARKVALHEMFHKGIQRTLGKRMDAVFDDIYENLNTEQKADFKDIMRIYKLDNNIPDDRRLGIEEMIAKIAETTPKASILKRVVRAIRKILTDLGVLSPQEKWTDADITALIAEAHGALRRNRAKPISEVTLTEQVQVEETGEVFDVETNAEVVLRQHDKRVGVVEKLRACL